MNKVLRALVWGLVVVVGAAAVGVVALRRGEPINALWFVVAAGCCYALGYRFYSSFIAVKILAVDSRRATPAERLENGRDFLVTNKWVVFGHHFAAIAGPGPLVGPVLAAQFGYLPGTLWILAGAVFAGCVQDFVILMFSVRRDGKSLTEIAKDETGPIGGFVAYAAVIAILVILLAVVALVIVNALKDSPWGAFTIAMTIPIAFFMGIYLRRLRPGKVLEVQPSDSSSCCGDLGWSMGLAEFNDGWMVHPSCSHSRDHHHRLRICRFRSSRVASSGASRLPQHLRETRNNRPPRYRHCFATPYSAYASPHKICGWHGAGFWREGFSLCVHHIACGAISGFHAHYFSGTTPKLISRETETRMVGYGSMIAESAVAVMAMIAACVLQPGVYFAVNSPSGVVGQTAAAATATISNWGFAVTAADMQALAHAVGEQSLLNRTGGAPAFTLCMAHIFSESLGGGTLIGILVWDRCG